MSILGWNAMVPTSLTRLSFRGGNGLTNLNTGADGIALSPGELKTDLIRIVSVAP